MTAIQDLPCILFAERKVWPRYGGLFGAPAETVYERRSKAEQRYLTILINARQYLDQVGWTWGWGTWGRPVCLMGAIAIGAGKSIRLTDITYSEEGQACAHLLGFSSPEEAMSWNDNRSRTKRDVKKRLDTAIRKLSPKAEVTPPTFEGDIKVTDQREADVLLLQH